MPGVTKEQITRAREWDLLSYLTAFEPSELVKCGPREYCTRSHDSLKISNGKWCWNSRGIGGRTALDYLIKVEGLPFVRAVETLCGSCPPPTHISALARPPRPFALPRASLCPSSVVPYLQGRGIDSEIIGACMESDILYESRRHQNCVFVGRDAAGIARCAFLRGTRDGFKAEAEGSDKRFGFCLTSADPGCARLAAAESAIDALSLATLVKRSGGDWRTCHYLSLGGTAPRALLQFLRDHPKVTEISLCLDNDHAGLTGAGRLEQALREDEALSSRIRLIYHNPPAPDFGKDYNELLCAQIRLSHVRAERKYEKVK